MTADLLFYEQMFTIFGETVKYQHNQPVRTIQVINEIIFTPSQSPSITMLRTITLKEI
jgi:hypothetical protein